MTEAVIRCECIASPEQRLEHVRSALSRGLPEVEFSKPRRQRLHIYANGPTAKQSQKKWPCMALNGALGLFGEHEAPTYWAACDPQDMVAGFVATAPLCTTYLLSSRCAPAVFDALSSRSVNVWHQADDFPELRGKRFMPEAPSITITALYLAAYMGFRKVTVHGWDGCVMDGKSHAVEQPSSGVYEHADFMGERYVTTLAWMAELQDAITAVKALPMMDITATGAGMIASVVRYANTH